MLGRSCGQHFDDRALLADRASDRRARPARRRACHLREGVARPALQGPRTSVWPRVLSSESPADAPVLPRVRPSRDLPDTVWRILEDVRRAPIRDVRRRVRMRVSILVPVPLVLVLPPVARAKEKTACQQDVDFALEALEEQCGHFFDVKGIDGGSPRACRAVDRRARPGRGCACSHGEAFPVRPAEDLAHVEPAAASPSGSPADEAPHFVCPGRERRQTVPGDSAAVPAEPGLPTIGRRFSLSWGGIRRPARGRAGHEGPRPSLPSGGST